MKIIQVVKAMNNQLLIHKDLREIETLQILLAPLKESQLNLIQEALIRKGQVEEGMGTALGHPEAQLGTARGSLALII